MAKPLKIQIVERARALIADEQHWCRGVLAEDATGASVFPTSASAVKRRFSSSNGSASSRVKGSSPE